MDVGKDELVRRTLGATVGPTGGLLERLLKLGMLAVQEKAGTWETCNSISFDLSYISKEPRTALRNVHLFYFQSASPFRYGSPLTPAREYVGPTWVHFDDFAKVIFEILLACHKGCATRQTYTTSDNPYLNPSCWRQWSAWNGNNCASLHCHNSTARPSVVHLSSYKENSPSVAAGQPDSARMQNRRNSWRSVRFFFSFSHI
ncbi:uncharacterized protein BDR25DRAFT_355179 [Lindgomyces ingoldianus]|uniref:Uncharacterized protein n=1 Tax=Lindgomyces ingoldianus TaxID=673940 RepID=A0ACB6QV37_9PLEO|nr:uncharacterized protein BDR25DRAFT_355179 [Lindgomyces ingoldianus]KAF2470711.1 hypothetical protein BDR25DRAFT_355179 [Lindgomyces ingoldianus]